MKKIVIIVALLTVGAFISHTLLSSNSQSTKDIIKIGVIGPYTGVLAQYGEAYRNGVLLAEKELRDQGVDNIEFIFEDSEYDTAKAVSAFRKLTTVDDVDLVMDWGAATSYGIAPLVEDSGTPFVAFSVDPDVSSPSTYIVRHFYSPDDFAEVLWSYFRENGYKNIAIAKLQLLYYDKITDALKRQVRDGETVTVLDEYQFGDNDFRTSIAKLRTSADGSDVLGVFLAGGQIAQFYKQMAVQDLLIPTFGADFFESYSEIEDANGLMDGAVYANIGATDAFVTKYEEEFSTVNQVSFAGQSYDFVNLIVDKVDFTDSESILSSLQKIKNYKGTLGNYTYTEVGDDRYLKSPVYIKTIVGNTIQTSR